MSEEGSGTEKAIIFNDLTKIGCCKRCALRYVNPDADFDNPENDVKQFCESTNQDDGEEQVIKKSKSNPCIVCLDLLSDETLENMILRPEVDKMLEYDCDTFINYISFPTSVLLREHSLEIYVREKFSNFFKDHYIVPINRTWSLSIQNKLSQKLKKKLDKNALHLQIQFTVIYDCEEEETSVMRQLGNGEKKHIGRNSIGDTLKTIEDAIFKKQVAVPPGPPSKAIVIQEVTYKHNFIYIAGRYCKYSRDLFQTPWVDDEGEAVKASVQEIIFQSLDNIFKSSSLVFSSSGREDFDVRTLGRGRPFFVKVCDPKVTKVSYEKFRLVEKMIKRTNLVRVRDLQFIDRKYVNNIKEGEQFKKKTYRALCIVDKPENISNYIEKINNITSVTLQQKTPLRVYHRRSSDIRERVIYSLEARPVKGRDNLFELDMVTQAGTYVKEFVHGDLGRTTPSLSKIIGGSVDIIALDVMDIHLDFPPQLTKQSTDEISTN